jgi:hypothetical protein
VLTCDPCKNALKMLTHMDYGETLCGWLLESKGDVKGVSRASHRVTERFRP